MITNLERAEQAFVHAHHCTGVVELATVIGGAKQGNKLALGEKLVTVLNNLVSTADEIHVVFLKEPGNDIWTKRKRHTAVVFGPTSDILVWVRP